MTQILLRFGQPGVVRFDHFDVATFDNRFTRHVAYFAVRKSRLNRNLLLHSSSWNDGILGINGNRGDSRAVQIERCASIDPRADDVVISVADFGSHAADVWDAAGSFQQNEALVWSCAVEAAS